MSGTDLLHPVSLRIRDSFCIYALANCFRSDQPGLVPYGPPPPQQPLLDHSLDRKDCQTRSGIETF